MERLIIKLLRLALIPFAMLMVLFIRLSYPKLQIRISNFLSERIGHLAGNTGIYLCEREAGMHDEFIDLWTHHGTIANKQLAKMINRAMNVDQTRFLLLVILCNKLFQGWEQHDIGIKSTDRDFKNLLEKYPPQLTFTAREEAHGEEELRKMGIPAGAKWVCLIVRDGAYLPDLKYHAYRDSDIDTYAEAALALAERGYYVIRMGAKVEKRFACEHPKIIDYAANGMRSEFMDIYLAARCAFAISTGCGMDAVCVIFMRPLCFVNYVPLEYLNTWAPHYLAIWKHHEKDGKRMSPSEIYKSGAGQFLFANQYGQAGITLIDNTPQELKDASLEMADIAEGKSYDLDQAAQDAFWRDFPRNVDPYTNKPLHGEIRMRIGREFLKGYQ